MAPSYALLFRHLLSITANASSLRCLSLEVDGAPKRRKARTVDSFTQTGRQCIVKLRQLILERFTTPSAVEDEIKAMIVGVATDSHVLDRVQEELRQGHREVYELLAAQSGAGNAALDEEEEDEEEDEDDEISALLIEEPAACCSSH
ncbi:hypothetical protein V7S43_010265 [Phytophthora oleae]|uniref:DEK C-terminal domain-containing protein n=1 Tax=Phytophthora oleae TaxID=2107226 RepID=A0ABD3FCR5_9STRA